VKYRDDPQFPTTGWAWRRVIDASPASDVCQYCGQEPIRYVHVLDHPTAGSVRVGCDCAEDLTGRGGTAEAAEKPLRDSARRLAAWLDHADWHADGDVFTRRIGGKDRVAMIRVERQGLWWTWRVQFTYVSPPAQTVTSECTFASAGEAKTHLYQRHFEKTHPGTA
jgi:hypothetical protein